MSDVKHHAQDVDQIRIVAGAETAPHGRIELLLSATGKLAVEQRGGVPDTLEQPPPPDKAELREGHRYLTGEHELPSQEAREILDRVNRNVPRLSEQSAARMAAPDETLVRWELHGAAGTDTHRLWLRDAEQDPELGPVVRRLRALLDEIGGGEIIL